MTEVVKAIRAYPTESGQLVEEDKPSTNDHPLSRCVNASANAAGERCILRIAVTQRPVTDDVADLAIVFELPEGKQDLTTDVLVTAHDFEILGSNYQSLTIPVADDSKPIMFELIPKSTGTKLVRVEFFQHNKYVGGQELSTMVVEASASAASDRVTRAE